MEREHFVVDATPDIYGFKVNESGPGINGLEFVDPFDLGLATSHVTTFITVCVLIVVCHGGKTTGSFIKSQASVGSGIGPAYLTTQFNSLSCSLCSSSFAASRQSFSRSCQGFGY